MSHVNGLGFFQKISYMSQNYHYVTKSTITLDNYQKIFPEFPGSSQFNQILIQIQWKGM